MDADPKHTHFLALRRRSAAALEQARTVSRRSMTLLAGARWPYYSQTKPPVPGRVLIVDDHAPFRAATGLFLRTEGYEVAEVGSVADARARARTFRPTVALVDWHLPDGDGADVARLLHADNDGTLRAVVAITGGEAAAVEEDDDAPFAAVLTKPCDLDVLAATLARFTARDDANLGGVAVPPESIRDATD